MKRHMGKDQEGPKHGVSMSSGHVTIVGNVYHQPESSHELWAARVFIGVLL